MHIVLTHDISHYVHESSCRSVDFASVKHGVGTLVATAAIAETDDPEKTVFTTHLSTVSHKSPLRLIPTTPSSSSMAKQVCVSHYGGGMARGDSVALDIHVQSNARLHVRTQGTNRVYGKGSLEKHSNNENQALDMKIPDPIATNNITAIVDDNAILVYAPDPVSLHSGAQYKQCTDFILQDYVTSNLVAVDWICSGRQLSTKSEHWNHDSCTTRTTLRFAAEQGAYPMPSLIDAQSITAAGIFCVASNPPIHAVVSIILSGSLVVGDDDGWKDSVVQRFLHVQSTLAARYTSVRTSKHKGDHKRISREVENLITNQLSKDGRIVVGVSKSEKTTAIVDFERSAVPLYTIRMNASSNEDIYRILHYCLQPLAPYLDGVECYKDRIVHASHSPPARRSNLRPASSSNVPCHRDNVALASNQPLLPLTSHDARSNFWAAYMLADSALPIGSFSHSTGIEVANQLGFLRNEGNTDQYHFIASFVQTAVISSLQQSVPLIVYSSCIAEQLLLSPESDTYGMEEEESFLKHVLDKWVAIDAHAQAMLATNAPACRASLDQGRNLLRVARSALLSNVSSEQKRRNEAILEMMLDSSDDPVISENLRDCGHVSTVLGVITRLLLLNDKDAVRLYGYCVARDIVNAAVRLNLIGPMAGQAMLVSQAEPAAHRGILRAYAAMETSLRDPSGVPWSEASIESVAAAAMGCAPVLDAIHPCHDVLATRLFQT